jgi:hypothetical protein
MTHAFAMAANMTRRPHVNKSQQNCWWINGNVELDRRSDRENCSAFLHMYMRGGGHNFVDLFTIGIVLNTISIAFAYDSRVGKPVKNK